MILTLHHLIRDCSIDCWACEPRVFGFPLWVTHQKQHLLLVLLLPRARAQEGSLRCLNGSDVVTVH